MEKMTAKSRYEAVQEKLKELSELNVDCQEAREKLKRKLKELSGEKLSIALVGAFSDGKTSVIAGLAGETLDGMEIAVDEATDGLHVYESHMAKTPCRMIDTPGLFGTKEMDVAGELRHFDAITRKYFSDAPVLLYVMESKNPIKDSHKELLRHVMHELGKADRTIFVINKMDDVADVTDAEEYAKQAEIKKNTVRMKLQELIGLSMEEVAAVRIVCVAADPGRKGMAFWKEHMEAYRARSHMDELRAAIRDLLDAHTEEELLDHASLKTAEDVLRESIAATGKIVENAEKNILPVLRDVNAEQRKEIERTKAELDRERKACCEALDDYRNKLVGEIHGLTLENAEEFLKNEIGCIRDEYGHIFEQRLKDIWERHSSVMDSEMKSLRTTLTDLDSRQESVLGDYVKKAVKGINFIPKNAAIQGVRQGIFIGRDLIGKLGIVIKFKPWQVVKIARFAPAANLLLSLLAEVYEVIAVQQRNEKLKQLKKELHDVVEEAFRETRNQLSGEEFYKNCAPHIQKIEQKIEEGREEIRKIEKNTHELAAWKSEAEDLLRRMQTA